MQRRLQSFFACSLAPLVRPPRRVWAPCPFFSCFPSCPRRVYAVACTVQYGGFWLPPATKTTCVSAIRDGEMVTARWLQCEDGTCLSQMRSRLGM
ncbi:hypothetical protein CCMA1212_006049 [Trichoderma ghanense]|uniref:Secreted protein n=1 Tax=Trichoderma ghanense TaxID=65468 RepID=A0ABY2H231_9HYPO